MPALHLAGYLDLETVTGECVGSVARLESPECGAYEAVVGVGCTIVNCNRADCPYIVTETAAKAALANTMIKEIPE